MKKNYYCGCKKLFFTTFICVFICSCSQDKEKEVLGKPFDPSKPVTLETFYPDSGGIATKVIIKGDNFGNDPKNIRVWYNKKKASVVKTIGNMIYVITPKQPGDTSVISVAVGNDASDSVSFKQKFRYTTTTTVTTIAGKAGKVSQEVDGTLAEAEFDHPRYLCVDAENNIFVSEFLASSLRQINEERNIVTTIFKKNGLINPNAPCTDSAGKVIFVPIDKGNVMFEFNPEMQWAGRRIVPRKDDTSKDFTIDWKHSLAINVRDGMVYTRAFNGQLIKFNTYSKAAFLVASDLVPGADAFLCFDPIDMDILYISYGDKHCIYTFNLKTNEHKLLAGEPNKKGWADGECAESLLNEPRQICITDDGTLYIADSGNHCIRKISRDKIISTVVGIPGVKGYRDGTPEEALFDTPTGVSINKEGVIYIADYENLCIRRLAIE